MRSVLIFRLSLEDKRLFCIKTNFINSQSKHVDTQKNGLAETVLLRSHNICLDRGIGKQS